MCAEHRLGPVSAEGVAFARTPQSQSVGALAAAVLRQQHALAGRVVVVSGASRGVGRGIAIVVADLAREYGVVDVDGSVPRPLREIAARKRAERKSQS